MAKQRKENSIQVSHGRRTAQAAILILCTALYFLAVCLCSAATIKWMGLALAVLLLSAVFLFFPRLREQIGIPLLLLALVVLMDGISTQYAVTGKFALFEFLKVFTAFCLALLLLGAAPGEGRERGRWIAKVLSGFTALAGLTSIDLLSTRWFSGLVLGILGKFTPDYAEQIGIEAGKRMYGMFFNPNTSAGVAGIGVLLSLGLVCSAKGKKERAVQTAILYINSLSFLLLFSMGATAAIVPAFLVLLVLEQRSGRTGLLLLMVETLAVTVLAAGVISMTSFQAWTGPRPIPMLCVILGAAALCALDRFVGQPLAGRLAGKSRVVPVVIGAIAVGLIVYIVAAYNLTGPASLAPGETLRRAAYPEPGVYTLSVETDGLLYVTVESQNKQDTMMHTESVLYQGDAAGAVFTVPGDSLVVYFNFYASDGAQLQSASFAGDTGSGSIPMGYKLLPGFIANRLQGLWANENAIQRLVFFEDGLKLFRRSPIIGQGLGIFENSYKNVQTFYYVTKYVHNHYIQTLAETGIVGLALWLILFGVSGAAVLLERKRGETAHPLVPALGAALVFMAAHGAVEVVFSAFSYLPVAFGVFALISLCCGEALPKGRLPQKAKTVSLLAISALTALFAVLLACNMHARAVADEGTWEALDRAVKLDRFEWADHALTYVDDAAYAYEEGEVREQADRYAQRLGELDSNSVPIHLADYYFQTGRQEQAFDMVEKYVRYVSSDQENWQAAFDLLERHEEDTEEYHAGVLRIARLLEDWNRANLGEVQVNEAAQALIARASG